MDKIKYPDSYAVWDLETTGFDFVKNRITEIGIAIVDKGEIVEQKSWLLNYNIPIPDHIVEITGITKELIDAEGQDPYKCFEEFFEMLHGKTHVTHNGMKFDIPFIVEQAAQIKNEDNNYRETLSKTLYRNAIDTAVVVKAGKLNMVREWNETFNGFASRVMGVFAKGVKYSIDACCEEMEIDKSQVSQHRAGGDVVLTNEIYKNLMKR